MINSEQQLLPLKLEFKQLKILFVSQYFYPEDFKGNDIVFDLVKKGHEVTVLTGKPNYPEGKFYKGYNFFNKNTEYIQGAKVIRAPLFPRRSGKALPLILNYLSFLFFSFFVATFRIKEKYDVVFVQQLSPVTMALPGIWIKNRQGIPLVLWVLDLWPESIVASSNIKSNFIIKPIEKLVKWIYNKSDLILVSSKFFTKSVLEKCKNENMKVEHFPNWAEDVFTNSLITIPLKEHKIPELPIGFNIMFAGNIGEAQDFEAIINAAEITKNLGINWILIGDGRKLEWVRNEVKVRNITNIYIKGRYPIESMPKFFKKADAMLVSLKDEPIFSLTVPAKIQAYMASGKIILGMLNGEGNALINNSNCGFAANAGDSIGLAEFAVKLKNSSIDKIKEMENNSTNYYCQFFEKKLLMSNLEKMLIEIVDEGGKGLKN